MLNFKVKRVQFPKTTGRDQLVKSTIKMDGVVKNACVAVNGFDIQYTDGDHHLGQLRIDCSDIPSWSGQMVDFNVNFLLRDWSGDIDDRYKGWVDVLVIAEI